MSDEATDDDLLFRTAEGDRIAFGLLIRRYQGIVTRFACRLLNADQSAAEDIGQETFLRLYHSSATYTARGQLRAYLLTITRNLCRDHQRRQRPTESLDVVSEHPSSALNAEALVLQQERSEAVRQAISALPEEQQTVLILSHYEGLPYHEIAVILGCPTGTVASRKHHAVAFLRRRLHAYLEET